MIDETKLESETAGLIKVVTFNNRNLDFSDKRTQKKKSKITLNTNKLQKHMRCITLLTNKQPDIKDHITTKIYTPEAHKRGWFFMPHLHQYTER